MRRQRLQINALLMIAALSFAASAGAAQKLVYFQEHARFEFDITLLKMALARTADEFGDVELAPLGEEVNEARGLRLLENGKVDIAFIPTNRERELRFTSVKFPILSGLLGYRLLLIHEDKQSSFASLNSLDQLRRSMIAGFGLHWADMQILYANQLPVIGHPNYEELFNMLQHKRFDYFPRGINEIWGEVASKQDSHPQIKIEQHLALYYPFPRYYFVNRHDKELARRLQIGLEQLKADGSYQKLFRDSFGQVLADANITGRTVLTLKNPFLSEGTPLPDTSLWRSEQRR